MDTNAAARGRWRQILLALGLPSKALNGKQQPCPLPGCGGTDRFQFTDRNSDGDYICRQCGAGKGATLLMKFHGLTFREAANEVDKIIGNLPPPRLRKVHQMITAEDVQRIWGEAQPIENDTHYLRGRGVELANWPRALRYVARWKHSPTQKYLPCMFALFTDQHGCIGTIHRTYLADVIPRRMFLPRPIPKGGAIRLGDAREHMGVAEGIETALSAAMMFKMPVWATTSERLLREWIPPPEAKQINVFGDNDANYIGQAAAYHLANRLVLGGYRVWVKIPKELGWDWNDVLNQNFSVSKLRVFDRADGLPSQPVSDANGELGR